MSHDARFTLAGNHCTVHGYHWPPPTRTVKHHIQPLEYGGKSVATNIVLVCDNGHYSIHEALDALLAGEEPPKVTRHEMALARQGYEAVSAWKWPPRPA